ncbi:YkgJ family cysteine cluster protein [Natronorubrum sediminis]|uniref:YkgJ family cysteine cluster protein n=1 Tax=Natronorubrum sediminis TaxID=640943 RepID=UPI000B876F4E|nr:YkgJ family cysteine cluster protein [Natronorubrum sediminis]
MQSLEAELESARALDVADLADAIESIGFECTRCGACCKGHGEEEHTATVFPEEIRTLAEREAGDSPATDGDSATEGTSDDETDTSDQETDTSDHETDTGEYDWRDVARPMPYGLTETDDGLEGETFEWALQTDSCGDCTFYETTADGTGACSVHEDRPLICQTYPFSIDLAGTSQPMGEAVDEAGDVRAHECEGLGRDISREDAEALARTLKDRAITELEQAIGVRDTYEPADPDPGEIVVHDSEGAKRDDGTPLEK